MKSLFDIYLLLSCLLIPIVFSCGRNDISSKDYYMNCPNVGRFAGSSDEYISGINLIPVKLDSMETSYVGYFWLNRDTLYFSDMYYYYIYSFRPDGSIIGRYVGRGQGPGEVKDFDFSIPFSEGYYLHSTSMHYSYLFDNQWKLTSQSPIYWGGKNREGYRRINNPNPAEPIFYVDNVFSLLHDHHIQLWDSARVAVFISTGLPKLNAYFNTGLYYNYSRILLLLNMYTGEVDRIFGRRSPVFLEKSNLPTMDNIGFAKVADTVFVSFFPDSVIYMIDADEDRAIGKFGRQGRNMNTKYVTTQTVEEAFARQKEDWYTLGYYTYLKHDDKRQLLFRGYTQGAHSEYDGLQIYKDHALIGDVDVPKGFYIIGYLNDQLIGAIDDVEIKELDLYFYHVNFEIQNASAMTPQADTEVKDGNGLLTGENTFTNYENKLFLFAGR